MYSLENMSLRFEKHETLYRRFGIIFEIEIKQTIGRTGVQQFLNNVKMRQFLYLA